LLIKVAIGGEVVVAIGGEVVSTDGWARKINIVGDREPVRFR
jgi:hypothetical protein